MTHKQWLADSNTEVLDQAMKIEIDGQRFDAVLETKKSARNLHRVSACDAL